MNNTQINAVNMLLRVQQIFTTKRKSLFEGYKPLKKRMDEFSVVMAKLDGDIKAQSAASQSTTQTKDAAKRLATRLTIKLADKAHDWALQQGNANLVELFDVTSTDFNVDEIEVAALAENIVEAINPIIGDLADYNITQQQLDDAKAAVSSFKSLIGTPQVGQTNGKVLNGNINKDIRDAKKTLLLCDKLVRSEFSETENDAWKDYEGARFQGSSTRQHTALLVTVTDAQHNFVPNATVQITEIGRTDESDDTGVAEIIKFKAGSYNGTVKATGFKDASFSFTAKTGKKTEIEIALEQL